MPAESATRSHLLPVCCAPHCLAWLLFAVLTAVSLASTPQFPVPLTINPDHSITYHPLPNGDRIPDFSTVGYNYGNTPLPDEPGGYQVPVVVTLEPLPGDQTDRIQAAVDFIATRPLVNGFRGALLLKAGRWEIHSVNRITVRTSGIVIRGEGDHPLTGTRLYAVGTTNEANTRNSRNSRLIAFQGNSNTVNTSARTNVDAVYVPAGTNVIPITGHGLTVGQRIQIRWPGTVAWQIASLYNPAATADLDPAFTMNRIITGVTAGSITLDAPLTTPLDPAYATGYVVPVTAFNNITNVGLSRIYFESIYANDTDENHVWNAVDFTNVEDGFLHNCTARHFAYALAYVNTSTRKITINRSQVLDCISQLVGGRRYAFVLTGEMALVANPITRYSRHAFPINWPAASGPNVFVDGVAADSYNESGSHARWNNGGLWDNISAVRNGAGIQVKLERPSAYCVAWNCTLNSITFENMPLSPNWSFGSQKADGSPTAWINSVSTGSYAYAAPHIGKAEQWSNGARMSVRSLYENQLNTRLRAARNPRQYRADPPTRIILPPTLRTPDRIHASSGSTWSYQIPASNLVPATRTPNFTATGLPSGLTVNATTGLISGTVPTVTTETDYNLTLSVRNIDGTTTKPMTLTVRPAGAPKIPLAMSVEVDTQRTTSLALRDGQPAQLVPMVPATRLLAPMIVRRLYISDMNGAVTRDNIPVPVRGILPIEGLTSPVTVTCNGSTDLPTAPGFYDIVATLDDPVYSATATGRLLITEATSVTVTLGNTTAPTAENPVTATSTQPSIPPVITYDGSPVFPAAPGQYTAKAIVADPTYFGSRLALISVQRPTATLAWSGPFTLPYTGAAQSPSVSTVPAGLATRVSIAGEGILPGTYNVTAWIDDPAYNHTPITGTMTITGLVVSTPGDLVVSGTAAGTVVHFDVSAGDGFTATTPAFADPPSGSLFPPGTTTVTVTATDAGGQVSAKTFTVTVYPGPSNLQQINPFSGVAAGTADIQPGGTIRIVGAGGATTGGATADLWTGTNDSNTYLSIPWQGDGIFTARLASLSSDDSSAKVGLIFRETTSPGSRYSAIYLMRANGGSVGFQHKTATSGSSTNLNFFNGNATNRGVPEWIRLVRDGNTFTLFSSEDGIAWTQLSSQTNVISGPAQSVGLFVAPRTGNTSATAVFDNISFIPPDLSARQSWRLANFGTTTGSGVADDIADPDGDGFGNLLEYALGTAPLAAHSRPSMQMDIVGFDSTPGQFLALTFQRIADPLLTYTVEGCSNLVDRTWQPVWQSTGANNTAGPVTASDNVDISAADVAARFLRLKIHAP